MCMLHCALTTQSHISFCRCFSPLCPLLSSPTTLLWQSPYCCLCFPLNPFAFFTQPLSTNPLWQLSVCSQYLWVCFCFVSLLCSLGSTYKWNHMIFACIRLAFFTYHNVLQVHPYCCKRQAFLLFYSRVVFHCVHVPQLFYALIYWWTLGLLPNPDYRK